jgi:erythromycin esterase
MTIRACTIVLLLVTLPASASRAGAQDVDPLRTDRLAGDAEIAFSIPAPEPRWEPAVAQSIRSLVSGDYTDLEFLREKLRGVRIVQLGESGHGMGETALLKSRIARFLHGELGFEVLAFESDLYQCADADGPAGAIEPRSTMFGCTFGVWHVEEVLPLFEHLGASRATDHPLRLAGFDVQPIGTNKEHRPAYLGGLLERVDPQLAREARTTDSTFLARYAEGSGPRREYLRTNRESLLSAYERFAAALDDLARAAGSGRPDDADSAALHRRALVGRQTARSILAYIRQQTAPDTRAYAEARNLGMAENVRFLADELFPGRRIVVWGHNTHVRHASEAIPAHPAVWPDVPARDMGSWLHDWYGQALFTIGFYAYRGTAADNAREVYEVADATPAHLEYRLARAGYRLSFFDLERQGWAHREQTLRFNGQHDQVMVPAEQYDALILIVDVAPPRFLY